jgi:hypothetical protein
MNVLVVIFDRGSQFRGHFAFGSTGRTTFQLAGVVTTFQLAGIVTTFGSPLAALIRITMTTKSAARSVAGMGNHVIVKVAKVQ